MRFNNCFQNPHCLLQVHEGCVHHLQQKVDNFLPEKYDLHDRGHTSVPLHIGRFTIVIYLSITIAVNINFDVVSSSKHSHLSAYGSSHGGCGHSLHKLSYRMRHCRFRPHSTNGGRTQQV